MFWDSNSQYYGYDFIRTYRVNVINLWRNDTGLGRTPFQHKWCPYLGRGEETQLHSYLQGYIYMYGCKDVCDTHVAIWTWRQRMELRCHQVKDYLRLQGQKRQGRVDPPSNACTLLPALRFLGFQLPELWRNKSLLFHATQLVVYCYNIATILSGTINDICHMTFVVSFDWLTCAFYQNICSRVQIPDCKI